MQRPGGTIQGLEIPIRDGAARLPRKVAGLVMSKTRSRGGEWWEGWNERVITEGTPRMTYGRSPDPRRLLSKKLARAQGAVSAHAMHNSSTGGLRPLGEKKSSA